MITYPVEQVVQVELLEQVRQLDINEKLAHDEHCCAAFSAYPVLQVVHTVALEQYPQFAIKV